MLFYLRTDHLKINLYLKCTFIAGTTDRSSQTEIHEESRKFDPNYQWNEWDLRRQALRLAKMRNKITHSSQTYTSFSDQRKENDSQHISSSRATNSSTQTTAAQGVGTNHTTEGSKSLVIGLRGETSFPVEHIFIKDIISNARGTTCV